MRRIRLVLGTAAATAAFVAFATPAQAAEVPDYVTVEFQGPVVCVTEPCEQPTPVVVCVHHVAEYCTPR